MFVFVSTYGTVTTAMQCTPTCWEKWLHPQYAPWTRVHTVRQEQRTGTTVDFEGRSCAVPGPALEIPTNERTAIYSVDSKFKDVSLSQNHKIVLKS